MFLQRNQKQVKELCLSHPTPSYYNAINKILTAGMQRKPETFNEWQDLKVEWVLKEVLSCKLISSREQLDHTRIEIWRSTCESIAIEILVIF